jgi:hypothetical protein
VCVGLSSNPLSLKMPMDWENTNAPPGQDLVAISWRPERPYEIFPVASNYSCISVENPDNFSSILLVHQEDRMLETYHHSKENCAISTNGTKCDIIFHLTRTSVAYRLDQLPGPG